MKRVLLDGQSSQAIDQAAQVLARGELLGLPTETVYGLAGDADNAQAVRQIFATKGRPADHPLIVHVAHVQAVTEFASEVPEFAQRLMAAFWPGPLTLILPRRPERAAAAAGGQASVGLRCPSHPVAQALLHAAQTLGVRGVAAPSANRFGRVSPTTAAHVQQEFADLCVLDGGACEVGIESTIVDCTRGVPVLLRPGVITPDQLTHACAIAVLDPRQASASESMLAKPAPRASGTLEAHYAPQARVRLLHADDIEQAIKDLELRSENDPAAEHIQKIAIWSRQRIASLSQRRHEKVSISWQAMPNDSHRCAHDLFAVLRAFDAQAVTEVWVEQPPAGAAWDGVRDRLTRAAVHA